MPPVYTISDNVYYRSHGMSYTHFTMSGYGRRVDVPNDMFDNKNNMLIPEASQFSLSPRGKIAYFSLKELPGTQFDL
jgi:hypothetical protein